MNYDFAEKIKALVIDWLITNQPNVVIGNEVMYGSKRKVVDLLAVANNKIMAIEIKSASDNLNRLSEQLHEYNKVFDKVLIVSSHSHQENIKSILSKGIGLYVVDQKIKKVCPPSINHNQDKLEMLYSISSVFLKKQYPQYKDLNSDEIRLLLSKKKKAVVHQLLLSFYQQRLFERFHFFMNERGEYTLVDDIPTLSSLNRIELF